MGRNNVIFTLSLANYASGVDLEDCLNEMDLLTVLERPLKDRERVRIVKVLTLGSIEVQVRLMYRS